MLRPLGYVCLGSSPIPGADRGEARERPSHEFLMPLTIVDKARLLRGVPLLSEVSTEVLADLAAVATEHRSDEQTTLFQQGDPPDAFYVVIDGSVRAFRKETEVFTARPGDEVGALAVLDGRPRALTAVAEGLCHLLRIGADDFLYLLEQHHALAHGVIRHLTSEVRTALGGRSGTASESS